MAIRLALLALLAATALGVSTAHAAAPASTNGRLALMVLPKSQLGAAAKALEVKIGSGVQTNANAAEDSLDPNDTGGQLARGGRLSGYSLEYDQLSFQNLVRGHGLLAVGSSVDVFASAAAARRSIAKQLADGRKYDGKYVEAGFRLTEWAPKPVKGLGKGAVVIREALRLGDTRFRGTVVLFRQGKLMGSVGVTRADAKSDARYAVRLARVLAKRMKQAGGVSLGVQPVFVPQTAQQGRRPGSAPDLAAMALGAGDVPNGAQASRDAYATDRNALGKYVREFQFPNARLGGASLFTVENELNLLRSNAEASGVMVRLRALYGSPDVDRAFTDGFNVSGVKTELRKSVDAGDEAILLVLRIQANGRTAHIAQLSVRVGRVVALLNVGVVGTAFRPAAIEPLAVQLAHRIEAGLR